MRTYEQDQASRLENERYRIAYESQATHHGPWWTPEEYAKLPLNVAEPAACFIPACPRCRRRGNHGQPLATLDICYFCRWCALRVSFDGIWGNAGGSEWHPIEEFV